MAAYGDLYDLWSNNGASDSTIQNQANPDVDKLVIGGA